MKKIVCFICIILLATSLNARDIIPFKIAKQTNLPHVEVFVNNDSVPFNFFLTRGVLLLWLMPKTVDLWDY